MGTPQKLAEQKQLAFRQQPALELSQHKERGAAADMRELASAVFAQHPNAEVAFDAFDAEGRGKVTIADFRAGCQALFPVRFEGNVEQVFKALDEAESGFLNRKQFKALAAVFESMVEEANGFIYIDDGDDNKFNDQRRDALCDRHENLLTAQPCVIAAYGNAFREEVDKPKLSQNDQSESFLKGEGFGSVSLPRLSQRALRHTFAGSWGRFDTKRSSYAPAEKFRALRGKVFLSGTDGFAGKAKLAGCNSAGRMESPWESLDHRSTSLQMSGKMQTSSSFPRLRPSSR
jgi:hypothetical protein